MKIIRFFLFPILGCLCSMATAQKQGPKIIVLGLTEDNGWLTRKDSAILKAMRLTYKKPQVFEEAIGTECFKDNPKLEEILTCENNQLHSRDGQFIAFIRIYKPFDKQDSIDMKKLFPGGKYDIIDKMHINLIKQDLSTSLGKEAALNWKQNVKYYTTASAKEKFNADTAISVTIRLEPVDFYKGKYSKLEALYIQKRGRGFVNFYCFYTDEVKKNARLYEKYKKAIEGVFRYED